MPCTVGGNLIVAYNKTAVEGEEDQVMRKFIVIPR